MPRIVIPMVLVTTVFKLQSHLVSKLSAALPGTAGSLEANVELISYTLL